MWAHAAGVKVGVAGGRVNGVLFKVFADVLCGGLRQQAVDTLPENNMYPSDAAEHTGTICTKKANTEANQTPRQVAFKTVNNHL